MFALTINLLLLALEANQVVVLRMQRLQRGDPTAWGECALMIGEKVEAFGHAATTLARGQGVAGVVSDYRTVVRANIQRLRQDGPPNEGLMHRAPGV